MIDGMPYPAGVIPGPKGMAMIQMVKILAGLNPEDRTSAHFGGIKAEFDKIGWNLMVDSAPVGGAQRSSESRSKTARWCGSVPRKSGCRTP